MVEGGELFDKIIERTKFNEPEAKLYFYQNICHRDLKTENAFVRLCIEGSPKGRCSREGGTIQPTTTGSRSDIHNI